MLAIFRVLVCSIGAAVLVWLSAHAALLPATDVSDGLGHGPDIGSAEWLSEVILQTQAQKRQALFAGLTAGITALPLCTIVELARKKKMRVPQAAGAQQRAAAASTGA